MKPFKSSLLLTILLSSIHAFSIFSEPPRLTPERNEDIRPSSHATLAQQACRLLYACEDDQWQHTKLPLDDIVKPPVQSTNIKNRCVKFVSSYPAKIDGDNHLFIVFDAPTATTDGESDSQPSILKPSLPVKLGVHGRFAGHRSVIAECQKPQMVNDDDGGVELIELVVPEKTLTELEADEGTVSTNLVQTLPENELAMSLTSQHSAESSLRAKVVRLCETEVSFQYAMCVVRHRLQAFIDSSRRRRYSCRNRLVATPQDNRCPQISASNDSEIVSTQQDKDAGYYNYRPRYGTHNFARRIHQLKHLAMQTTRFFIVPILLIMVAIAVVCVAGLLAGWIVVSVWQCYRRNCGSNLCHRNASRISEKFKPSI